MKRTSRTKKATAKPSPGKTKSRTKTAKPKVVAKKPAATRAPKAARPTVAKTAPAIAARPAQRVIFIDVENTSSESTLLRVLEHLKVDRKAQPTEVIAIGNWKSVGTKVARTLASLGAQLVHSAPAPGVRDWSDLWIAVTAGRWLAHAAPGDQLDLVSDDRAFDAVHDAAASVGVVCTRISYRHIPGVAAATQAPTAQTPTARAPEERPHRPRRRGGRGHGRRPLAPSQPTHTPATAAPTPTAALPTAAEHAETRTASLEQIRSVLARLTGGDSTRWINLDLVATALKAEGFSRPPGSPRLITRMRSIKGVELNPNGMMRLVSESNAVPSDATSDAATAVDEAAPTAAARRPRRRGGRRHRRRPSGEAAETTAAVEDDQPADETERE
jgi:hypothetical protein